MCRYGKASGTYSSDSETLPPTYASCGFATTVANTSKPDAEAFSLASVPSTTYIATATPSAVFAPVEQVNYGSPATWKINGRTLVTARSPHPTKVMFYATINDGLFVKNTDFDIQSVGLLDFAKSPVAASLHLDLKASAVANRWNKLTPGPDGESVYLAGVIRGTTTPMYGRYVPGSALTVQAADFADRPTSIVGIFA